MKRTSTERQIRMTLDRFKMSDFTKGETRRCIAEVISHKLKDHKAKEAYASLAEAEKKPLCITQGQDDWYYYDKYMKLDMGEPYAPDPDR